MEFPNGNITTNKYKDSKHFVIDVCLYPSDNSQFLTVSLDGKIRMYSFTSNKLLKVLRGQNGVNSMAFLNSEIFITGSDDCTVRVWDTKRAIPVAVLK